MYLLKKSVNIEPMKSLANSKDLIMWLFYLRGPKGKKNEPIRGRTRLIKMLFIFREELWTSFKKDKQVATSAMPEFVAHHFGPYSQQVFEDLDFLIEFGFLQKRNLDDPSNSGEGFWEDLNDVEEDNLRRSDLVEYSLTPIGVEFVESGEAGELTENQKKIIEEFKHRCLSISLKDLVRYVYQKYPKYTKNSKIKDDVLND